MSSGLATEDHAALVSRARSTVKRSGDRFTESTKGSLGISPVGIPYRGAGVSSTAGTGAVLGRHAEWSRLSEESSDLDVGLSDELA